MEVFLANLAEAALAVAPEAATMSANVVGASAAEAAAAAAAADAAAAAAAAGVTTTGLGAIPEIATAGLPEVGAATLPEVGAAVPEVATTAVPEATNVSQGILQANNAALDTSMGPGNMGATNVTTPTGSIGPDFGQLGPTGVDTTVPNVEAANLGPNFTPQGGYSATDVADKGIGSYFDQGAKSASDLFSNIGDKLGKGMDYVEAHPKSSFAAALAAGKIYDQFNKNGLRPPEKYKGPLSKYHLAGNYQPAQAIPNYYTPSYQQAAQGGIMRLAMGGPATTPQPGQMYPGSQQVNTQFATPTQMPTSAEVVNAGYEPQTNPFTGNQPMGMAMGGSTSNPLIDIYKKQINPDFKEAPSADTGIHTDTDADTAVQDVLTAANTRRDKVDFMTKARPFKAQSLTPGLDKQKQQSVQAAGGGIMGYSLGGYAAGGNQPRLLKGPGDGMSDNIPATIADRQPARLADGEFVVPADVVSHLGNGSTDAGAKHLHKMMDKVRVARTGKKAQGTQINPNKYLPK